MHTYIAFIVSGRAGQQEQLHRADWVLCYDIYANIKSIPFATQAINISRIKVPASELLLSNSLITAHAQSVFLECPGPRMQHAASSMRTAVA